MLKQLMGILISVLSLTGCELSGLLSSKVLADPTPPPNSTLPADTRVTSLTEMFVMQLTKTKQSEAKQSVGSMNRAQQAYYLERDRFTSNFAELGLGIKPETENYRYRSVLIPAPKSKYFPSAKNRAVMNTGIAKKTGLKSYVGVVWIAVLGDRKDLSSIAVLCESAKPTSQAPVMPSFKGDGSDQNSAICPTGYSQLQ